jgi:poly-beta-1,6-N-acetyl-D-glucosamine synthase
MNSEKYAIITPVRDEAEFIGRLISSVVRQAILPEKWVIINDGSRDATQSIVEAYLSDYPFIELVNLADRGWTEAGGDSVFGLGLQHVDLEQLDFLARVDGDVSFGPTYFELLLRKFRENPRLGIASGEMIYVDHGRQEITTGPRFQTHGPNKFYRVACFREIGGLDADLGWDIVDNIKAVQRGWEARRITETQFIHHRRVASRRGPWGIFENWGKAAYLAGYHPLFFGAKFLRRLFTAPFLLGSLLMAYHYFSGYILRRPRIISDDTHRFVRREQLKKLMGRPSAWS